MREGNRLRRDGANKHSPQKVGWQSHAAGLIGGGSLIAYWWVQTHAGHIGWLNMYSQPVYAPMTLIGGVLFILFGLIPWDWLSQRAQMRDHRKRNQRSR